MLEAPELGTILGVWAHPDDEAYSSGALMALGVDDGRRVVCVTATRGEAGFPDDDPRSAAERAALRTRECAACLAVLGVTEHQWLGYADGGCTGVVPEEPVGTLMKVMDEVAPDTVLTFGPDGVTGHGDHIAVSRWTTMAWRRAGRPGRLLYTTNTPDWLERMKAFVDLDAVMMVEDMKPPTTEPEDLALAFRAEGPLLERKVEALRAQASQVEQMYQMAGAAAFRDLVAEEVFRGPRPDDWPDDI